MSLATQTAPNFEEAASVAAEFITSLDNLPSEVQHLLQEIKIKEIRCQDLQQDIAKDQSKYIKSALKHSSTPSTPSSAGQANSRTASPAPVSLPTDSRSKAHLPARISAAYAEIDSLTDEKVVLAQRIIELVTRTRARLDADLAKVRLLQGESPEDTRGAYLNAGTRLMSSSPSSSPYTGATKRESSVAGLNPVIQIGESLRSAMAGGVETPISAVGPGYTKKRKLTANTSIKLPSPAPALVHQSTTTNTRSRLSRSARLQQQEEEDLDADAEGDEDVEGDDGEDDTTLYCFCHKQSFGDMIGCDNDDCPYQWFHIECVGVKTPLPDKWYCPECINIVKPPAEKRKGRKK